MLPLMLAAQVLATAPQPARVAPGTYTYHASYNGADVGTSTITVSRSGDVTQIAERASGSYAGTSSTGEASLTLAADNTPTTYRANATMSGSPISDAATVSGATARVTTPQGSTATIALGSAAHFVVVDLGTFSGFVALPSQLASWNDAPVLAVIPSLGQSLGFTAAAATAARPAGVPATDAGVTLSGHAAFTVWYDPTTYVPDRIDMPSQNVTVTRVR